MHLTSHSPEFLIINAHLKLIKFISKKNCHINVHDNFYLLKFFIKNITYFKDIINLLKTPDTSN